MLFDKVINTAYSFGAAIVVFGAWAKLEHKDFSDDALTAGLMVETGIFCIYGLMEWRKEPAPGQQQQAPMAQPPEGPDMGELTATVRRTNEILNKVFRTEP
jgi:gliding motility-associated GldL-like protein